MASLQDKLPFRLYLVEKLATLFAFDGLMERQREGILSQVSHLGELQTLE